ncbi:uncharacterized protein PG986_009330 [Apiospora aurea]|uniref:Uncharacterized protein n=1 Tax=Apiospora aurea TaxID=335848 RepID=A0ABR1Q7E9_9PEZI
MNMSVQTDNPEWEFLCPIWVHNPTNLLDDLSFYMVDIITKLRNVDLKYSLPKAWLGNHLSPFERAQVIMQHMDFKPWAADTEEEFIVRLISCLRPEFIPENKDEVNHHYRRVLTEVPRTNSDHTNVEGLRRCLKCRSFFQTVLALILVKEDEEERPVTVDDDDDDDGTYLHHRVSRHSTPGNNSMSSSNSNIHGRGPYWGESPLDSIMDLPLMQKYRDQLRLQPDLDIVHYPDEPMRGPQLQRRHRHPLPKQRQQPTRTGFDLGRREQQLQQHRQVVDNDACYVEQSTGGTWLERHGITAKYEPKPKPKKPRNPFKRLARKFNTWLCAESVTTEYAMRRGGRSEREDARFR